MKSRINQIYIPAAPAHEYQNQIAIQLQTELTAQRYSPGLMLVILGGREGLRQKEEHHANLNKFRNIIKDWPFITMLSCTPCKELDLLNETYFGITHVKEGIDYTSNLPFEGEKILTFHLGSLVAEDEFKSRTKESWGNQFHKIIQPSLKEIAKYSRKYGVAVKIETTPAPEFGNIPDEDKMEYRKTKLNLLRNPFYLTQDWGFEQIKDSGLGICLDLCHNQTIYETARRGEYDGIFFPEDAEMFSRMKLLDDVMALGPSDLVHLNDGRGAYSSTKKTFFEEDVTLGEGNIKELDKIIITLNKRNLSYVLEINETDFKKRPNTKKSIDYLLKKEGV